MSTICRSLTSDLENHTYTNLAFTGPSALRYRIMVDGLVVSEGPVPLFAEINNVGRYGFVLYWGKFDINNERVRVEILHDCENQTFLMVDWATSDSEENIFYQENLQMPFTYVNERVKVTIE